VSAFTGTTETLGELSSRKAVTLLVAAAVAAAATLIGVYFWRRGKQAKAVGRSIDFEFGETAASNAFWDRNPKSFPAFTRLLQLTNKAFGRPYRLRNRVDDICFNLGETCRTDFLEILFLAVNGYSSDGTQRKHQQKGGFSSEQSVAVAQFIESSEERGRVGLDAEEGQALAIRPTRARMGARFC
jgi:hypothetical protein